jgi:teichoic acid transport system ATP-binding protein
MSETVIKIKNLSKTFKIFKNDTDIFINAIFPRKHKEIKALRKIDLEVKKGEVLGIIGYNGSGKTTLLKIISGIVMPDNGSEIEVNGTLGTMIALGTGFKANLTGRENIYYRSELLGISKDVVDKKIDKMIEYSGLDDRIEDKINTYSSGMKAKLGFAYYAFIEPDILVVDEITSVGDFKFKKKAKKTINDLFNSNKTILFVSHNLDEVENYCTRVLLLKKGKTIAIGKPKEIIDMYKKNGS